MHKDPHIDQSHKQHETDLPRVVKDMRCGAQERCVPSEEARKIVSFRKTRERQER